MEQLKAAVLRGIAGKRKEPLDEHERLYINRRLAQVNLDHFKSMSPVKIVLALVDMMFMELSKIPKKSIEGAIDVHEMMKHEIGHASETYNTRKKIDKDATVDSLLQEPATLQRVFNPAALRRKAYLVLDRRYQANEANNVNEFKWQISDTSRSYDALSTAVTAVPIKDIVKIKMFPFRFPSSDRALMDFYNLSVEIKELNNQACIITHTNKRYHFMFDLERTGSGQYEPYKANDAGNNLTEFEFFDPVIDLSEITVAFGNPTYTIQLDPDVLYGTIAPSGAQTEITFLQDHKCAVGCTIIIAGFNTSSPSFDAEAIATINHEQGHRVASVTATTMLIDINISTLYGGITGGPFYVYLNAKRFLLRLELTYLVDG